MDEITFNEKYGKIIAQRAVCFFRPGGPIIVSIQAEDTQWVAWMGMEAGSDKLCWSADPMGVAKAVDQWIDSAEIGRPKSIVFNR